MSVSLSVYDRVLKMFAWWVVDVCIIDIYSVLVICTTCGQKHLKLQSHLSNSWEGDGTNHPGNNFQIQGDQ